MSYDEFAKALMANAASQLGISYDQVLQTCLSLVTTRMVDLAASRDGRRRRRGWRLYFKVNGRCASHYALLAAIDARRWENIRSTFTDNFLDGFVDSAIDFGGPLMRKRSGQLTPFVQPLSGAAEAYRKLGEEAKVATIRISQLSRVCEHPADARLHAVSEEYMAKQRAAIGERMDEMIFAAINPKPADQDG